MDDLTEYFKEKYPTLFDHVGFDCGKGWKDIVEDIVETICEKLKGRGVGFTQIKEKFGTIRIYLDGQPDYRIELERIVGYKNGEIVGKEIPGADVLIVFFDSGQWSTDPEGVVTYYYHPKIDKFFADFVDFEDCNFYQEIEDRNFVKGRLAQLTGLVDAEPIEEEKTYDIINWAEQESAKTCEECGTTKEVTTEGSWIKTLCPTCRTGRMERKKS